MWHTGSFVVARGSPVVARGLSCPAACGILVPQPGIEPTSPALEGGVFNTGPPGKSQAGGSSDVQTEHTPSVGAEESPPPSSGMRLVRELLLLWCLNFSAELLCSGHRESGRVRAGFQGGSGLFTGDLFLTHFKPKPHGVAQTN